MANFYYSVTNAVWDKLTSPVVVAPTPTLSDIFLCMLPGDYEVDPDDVVFFNVVDPRPERKAQTKMAHIAKQTSCMIVSRFDGAIQGDGLVEMQHQGGTADIDLLGVCEPATLRAIMLCLTRWELAFGKRMLTFVPPKRLQELSGPALKPPVVEEDRDEDDMMLCLDFADVELDPSCSLDAQTTAQDLIGLRAFSENDCFASTSEIDIVGLAALADAGVVTLRTGDDGDQQVALNLSCIRMNGSCKCDNGLQDLEIEARPCALEKLSKLELMHHLRLNAWDIVEDAPVLLLPHDRLALLPNLNRSATYWICLAHSALIWEKPGGLTSISHKMPEHYYKCLLQLPDLTPLMEIEDLNALSDKDFKDILKDGGIEAMLAIGDADDDAMLAIGDAGDDGVDMPIVPAVLALERESPVSLRMEGFDEVRVIFNTATGTQRAIVECKLHHPRCRLYREMSTFASKAHCCAFMIAWALQGNRFPTDNPLSRQEHIDSSPTPEFEDSVYRKLL